MHHLRDIKDFIEILFQSENIQLLSVLGPPGWGKSSLTISTLEEMKIRYETLGSYATPLGLYNKLVEFPDIVHLLDDTSGLLQNATALAVLNAATWPSSGDGRREVRWTSTQGAATEASFIFKGKVILLTNLMPSTPQARALINRSLHYEIRMDERLVGEQLLAAAKNKCAADREVALKVAQFLRQNLKVYDAERFSLRTLEMGMELARLNPTGWQKLLEKILPQRRDHRILEKNAKEVVTNLTESDLRVVEQCEEFIKLTGKSARTFYYIRRKLNLPSSRKKPTPYLASALQ